MKKPMIGVLLRPDRVIDSGHKVMVMASSIMDVIIKYGGIPLGITPPYSSSFLGPDYHMQESEWLNMKRILSFCDGVILQGGDDFYDYDMKARTYLWEHDIPTLGICLGMQTMGVWKNGMLGSVSSHYQKDQLYVHSVHLNQNTKLYDILGQTDFMVNSRHHSQVLQTDLTISGYGTEHVIEAIEDPSRRFFIGVEWHPEDMEAYDILMNRLFTYFIRCCEE